MNKRILSILAVAFSALTLLTACSEKEPPEPTPEVVQFASGEMAVEAVTDIKMQLESGETALLDSFPDLKKADLSGSENTQEVFEWAKAHPDVKVIYTVKLPDGREVAYNETVLDLSSLSSADVQAATEAMKMLPKLTSVSLGYERPQLGWADLDVIHTACPNVKLNYSFSMYGLDFNTSDTIINLSHVPVDDEGEKVYTVMAYMPDLAVLDMDSCGVSNEAMAYIRDSYPNVKVIWRVWFGDKYSVRTDVERILASQPSVGGMLVPDNSQSLKYCTAVKYLDVGHNEWLTDISFVAYMPKLEVAVLAMDNWTDASPLANCKELEYLEMQTTLCTDLSPLAGLTKLRHLNIAYSPDLSDISPLYGLKDLERLWLGCLHDVPMEQVEQMQRAAPNCEINTEVYDDPTGGRWRYVDYNELAYIFINHPRYDLLREQFGYTSADFSYTWNDPLY